MFLRGGILAASWCICPVRFSRRNDLIITVTETIQSLREMLSQFQKILQKKKRVGYLIIWWSISWAPLNPFGLRRISRILFSIFIHKILICTLWKHYKKKKKHVEWLRAQKMSLSNKEGMLHSEEQMLHKIPTNYSVPHPSKGWLLLVL